MNGKHAYSGKSRDREAAIGRHAVAAETRRHMQDFPQFQADMDLTDQLRELLMQLEQAERGATRKR